MAKRFIEKIIYSKENIKISLFYSEILKNFAAQKSPAPRQRGGASRRSRDWGNLISSENSRFEADNIAAGERIERSLKPPKGPVLPLDDPAKIFKLNLFPLTHIEGFYQNYQKEICHEISFLLKIKETNIYHLATFDGMEFL